MMFMMFMKGRRRRFITIPFLFFPGKSLVQKQKQPFLSCRLCTRAMTLTITYSGPCDGLGRPVVMDGSNRGAPKVGKKAGKKSAGKRRSSRRRRSSKKSGDDQ